MYELETVEADRHHAVLVGAEGLEVPVGRDQQRWRGARTAASLKAEREDLHWREE